MAAPPSSRTVKDALYHQLARIGKAASSPQRLELVQLLAHGEKSVEALAEQARLTIKNASAHLRVLREARLVESRKQGQHVYYRLAEEAVAGFFVALRDLAERRLSERAEALAGLLGLGDLLDRRVAGLPYGVLKRVELAAVLATDPDLLLLDEPTSGMGPTEAHEFGDTLLELRRTFELTVVMIEHHVPLVTRVCDYVYCLNFGEMLAEGRPEAVRSHPEVVRAYLGEEAEAVI